MAKWHKYVSMVLVLQDEIWSEIVLKRLRTVRERTKEGLFGNIPYSFMTASQRARSTVLVVVNKLCYMLTTYNLSRYNTNPFAEFVLNLSRFNTN